MWHIHRLMGHKILLMQLAKCSVCSHHHEDSNKMKYISKTSLFVFNASMLRWLQRRHSAETCHFTSSIIYWNQLLAIKLEFKSIQIQKGRNIIGTRCLCICYISCKASLSFDPYFSFYHHGNRLKWNQHCSKHCWWLLTTQEFMYTK